MTIKKALPWDQYELIDSGDGQRLERFGQYTLVRPDPQILWERTSDDSVWENVDAVFESKDGEKECWHKRQDMPDAWQLKYQSLTLETHLSPFKHTGIFPEQTVQWDWIDTQIKNAERHINVLNLFAYTGIASLMAANAGASVTHVDASKPTIAWAKRNQELSRLTEKPIRWILDDALKFTTREVKRGKKYDAIIMDPPVYGHGPDGEPWDFMTDFPALMETCRLLLSDNPLFILINAYAVSASSIMLGNILEDIQNVRGGQVESGELAIPQTKNGRVLSTGIFGTISWI